MLPNAHLDGSTHPPEPGRPSDVRLVPANDRETLDAGMTSAAPALFAGWLEQSDDCVKLVGPGGTLDFMSRRGRCAMEIDDFDIVAGRQWAELWPATTRPVVVDALHRAADGHTVEFEGYCPTAAGTPRWWLVRVTPVRDGQGRIGTFLCVSRDISHLHAARDAP